MSFALSLDSRRPGGRQEPTESSEGQRKSSSWFSRVIAPVISENAVVQAAVNFFTAPREASYEPGLTGLGLKGQSVINDTSGFFRLASSLPVAPWTDSKYFPDTPNSFGYQVMGFTTATHLPLGALNLYQTAQGIKKFYDIGDTKGLQLGLLGFGTSLGQTMLGVGFAGIRTVNIASVIQPENSLWATLGQSWGYAGSAGGVLLYAGGALCELFAIACSFGFSQKYQEKGSVDYIRKRLGADSDDLQRKALDGKTREDLEKEGREYLHPFAKTDLELLHKHGFNPEAKEEGEFISQFLSPEDIREAGKISLMNKLQEKKMSKMSRAIGDEGVRALTGIFSEGEDVSKEEVDKIVLANLKSTNIWRGFRGVVYALGAPVMLCLMIFTAGTPLLVASVLFTIVALGELIIAIHGMKAQSEMREVVPGAYEKLIPYLGIAGTVAGVAVLITLASVYSFGIAPIALSLALSAVFLGLYCYQIYMIDRRREEHSLYLNNEKKGTLSLEEFKYVCTYLSNLELASHSPLKRLGWTNAREIEKYLNTRETESKNWRETLLYGLNKRQEELEEEYTLELWKQYQKKM